MATITADAERLRTIEVDICSGRYQEAAAALGILISTSPADPRVFLARAMLARATARPEHEIAALRHAIALAPEWVPAYAELAKALSRQGEHVQAIAVANRAVELAPRELAIIEIAVAVANAGSDFANAQHHLQAALALKPADPGIVRALATCIDGQGRYAEAEPYWRTLIDQNPNDLQALGSLGLSLLAAGRHEAARGILKRALALAPANSTLQFNLAMARGEMPRSQPSDMVTQLFDSYANGFDLHLQQLGYGVPKRVAEIIRQQHPQLDISVLDLGCGTGQLAAALGRIAGTFVGVDLSGKMLEQARRRNIYTDLRKTDLTTELQRSPTGSFDYIVANDVFIYVGDLSQIIPATFRVLRDGGRLIFSCETASESEGDLALRASKRYAHSRGSIETLCNAAGFCSCTIEPLDLRMAGGAETAAIAGFIAIANKG